MMGYSHAVSGAAAWVAVTSTAPYTLGVSPLPPDAVIAGALVTAGAALLPDVDHHSSTIAHSGGAATRAVARTAQSVSGGHRGGLHGLIAIAGFYVLTILAGRWLVDLGPWQVGPVTIGPYAAVAVGSALMFLALVAFALKVLKLSTGSKVKLWLVSLLVTAGVVVFAPQHFEWLPLAVLVGVAAHLAGDFITTGGLVLLWPWIPKPPKWWGNTPVLGAIWKPNGYMALPILGNAGSFREWVLVGLMAAYALFGLVDQVAAMFGTALPLPAALGG